jgi:hypothetical protein
MSDKPTKEEMQARAKEKAEAMRTRRLEHGYIAGSPGTLGESNTNRSIGDQEGPLRTLGLDDKPPR